MNRKVKTTPKAKSQSAAVLAAAMVRDLVGHSDYDIICDLRELPQWQRLAGRNQKSAIVSLEEKLRAALPADMQATMRDYSDLRDVVAMSESEASFTLGRAFERQIGGAR